MDQEYWLKRWRENRIGFHEGRTNSLLSAHIAKLDLPKGATIFVPLCGKAHDMRWLRDRGYRVVGAELSREAVDQFLAEQGDTEGITFLIGDIFDLDAHALGPVDAVYDRAALVALPPEMRVRYAVHLIELTANAPQLLLTFDYDQSLVPGPPFSVPDDEVRRHYEAAYRMDLAEKRQAEDGVKGFPAEESTWLLRRRT